MPLQLTWTDYPEPADSPDFIANSNFSPRIPASFEHLLIKGDNYPVLKKLGGGAADCPDLTAAIDLIYIDRLTTPVTTLPITITLPPAMFMAQQTVTVSGSVLCSAASQRPASC